MRRELKQKKTREKQAAATLTKLDIKPRNEHQSELIKNIRSNSITFCSGMAGTGKTFIAVALAIESLLKGKVKNLVITRPIVESGEHLGHLPGTLEEKSAPYIRPIHDTIRKLVPLGLNGHTTSVKVCPLAYMRGSTYDDTFIILDEAQNTTIDQMLMFLTRIGTDSKMVITGDPQQSDLPCKHNGLSFALSCLRNIDDIAFTEFDENDVVRHTLIPIMVKRFNAHKDKVFPDVRRNQQ